MKKLFSLLSAILFALVSCSEAEQVEHQAEAFVSTSPTTSGEYVVNVNGKDIPVYTAKAEYEEGIYYFATFDFEGTAKVRVTSKGDLSKTQILPAKYGFVPKIKGRNKLSFKADKPFRVSIERDGKVLPLLLFGNRPDEVPQKSDDVIFIEPGRHDIPLTKLTSGQTLYLAEGAVLVGAVIAEGDGITIAGKGVICGDGYEKYKGPGPFSLKAESCTNLTVKDIIISGAWSWTFVMLNCDRVKVDNIKICCSNILNDDAIDICNSSNVDIRNSFLRTQDDIFAIKGLDMVTHRPCENITIENCETWTDKANIFRIGYECDADYMAHIYAKDIDVLHYSRDYRVPEDYWANTIFWIQPSNGMMIEDCRFEDFRINAGYNDIIVIEAKSCLTGHSDGTPNTEAGYARNIRFKGISVTGDSSVFKGQNVIQSYDEDHYVKDVTVEGMTYFGKEVNLEDTL